MPAPPNSGAPRATQDTYSAPRGVVPRVSTSSRSSVQMRTRSRRAACASRVQKTARSPRRGAPATATTRWRGSMPTTLRTV
jgi:hypothetical protein